MRAAIRRFLGPCLWILPFWFGSGVAQAQRFTFEGMGGLTFDFAQVIPSNVEG